MFNDGDEMFHHLIRTQLILPYVKGDFYEAHLAEATGANSLRSKNPSNCCHWLDLAEGISLHLRRRGKQQCRHFLDVCV